MRRSDSDQKVPYYNKLTRIPLGGILNLTQSAQRILLRKRARARDSTHDTRARTRARKQVRTHANTRPLRLA